MEGSGRVTTISPTSLTTLFAFAVERRNRHAQQGAPHFTGTHRQDGYATDKSGTDVGAATAVLHHHAVLDVQRRTIP